MRSSSTASNSAPDVHRIDARPKSSASTARRPIRLRPTRHATAADRASSLSDPAGRSMSPPCAGSVAIAPLAEWLPGHRGRRWQRKPRSRRSRTSAGEIEAGAEKRRAPGCRARMLQTKTTAPSRPGPATHAPRRKRGTRNDDSFRVVWWRRPMPPRSEGCLGRASPSTSGRNAMSHNRPSRRASAKREERGAPRRTLAAGFHTVLDGKRPHCAQVRRRRRAVSRTRASLEHHPPRPCPQVLFVTASSNHRSDRFTA